MTTSIAETILQGAHQLRKAGVPEARRDAGTLLAYVLGQDRSYIISHAEDELAGEAGERFHEYLQRRAHGEPLQYITGRQEFFRLDFEVTSEVLIPRPETELLIETALKLLGSQGAPFICEVGTGSGCIAITLLHELSQARAVALEISPGALGVARRNAERHEVAERLDLVLSDCFAALNQWEAARSWFDLIVSNPPYVEQQAIAGLQREVRDFEPRAALDGGADGLDIVRRLLVDGANFLKPDGHLLFEIGFTQAAAVQQLIDQRVWRLLDIHADLQGIPRTVALQKLG